MQRIEFDTIDVDHTLIGENVVGQITASEHPEGGYTFGGVLVAGYSDEQYRRFLEWAADALRQLADTMDPERNGWTRSGLQLDTWYLSAVEHVLDSSLR